MNTIQRLLSEPLIRANLAATDIAQMQAQEASNDLVTLPTIPMLDRDIEIMFDARALLWRSLRIANRHQAKLSKIVRFYLDTY